MDVSPASAVSSFTITKNEAEQHYAFFIIQLQSRGMGLLYKLQNLTKMMHIKCRNICANETKLIIVSTNIYLKLLLPSTITETLMKWMLLFAKSKLTNEAQIHWPAIRYMSEHPLSLRGYCFSPSAPSDKHRGRSDALWKLLQPVQHFTYFSSSFLLFFLCFPQASG